ncbi:TetR/AcrR family transcriptional regulator [Mycolicibacterium fluoranthenivorans]|uniref:TetR/AcrR family transcriptional regulator n=1 Tax=Mycolicibacterium fluoranthenivorans TaxID=258505 RepID=UPI0021F2E9F9|nr:TetR/AcrR family transcriptional regulator [Mycolicibacterium fluoranthenivorans]MCV7354580.1 TetR/AcrR family transcriptional regulator [Mycolicibacterium fluoranthenivorans]
MEGQRSYGGISADERTARRRRQLLDAGLEIFGSTGYRAATVRQVCRVAKVADRYFYDQFRTMEDLLVAVYQECVDRLEDSIAVPIQTAGSVAEMARLGLESFLAAVQDDPRLARVVWFEVLGVSPEVETTYLSRMARFGELLITAAPAPFAVVPELRPLVADAVIGGISHVVMTWLASGFAAPRADVVTALELFLTSVAGGTVTAPE